MQDRPEIKLYLDDHRGIMIPRDFAEGTRRNLLFGVDDDTLAMLTDPDGESYWDAWDDVCRDAFVVLIGSDGNPAAEHAGALAVAKDADLEGRTDARDSVLATIPGLVRYSLYQDGALWLVPEGMSLTDSGSWVYPDEVTDDERDEFTSAYVECALWCGVMDGRSEELNSYDGNDLDDSDLTDAARLQLISDAHAFVESHISDIRRSGLEFSQAGHDFWLTRNRHGAGFWDRKHRGAMEDVALDRLAEASHAYGEMDLILTEPTEDTYQVGVL